MLKKYKEGFLNKKIVLLSMVGIFLFLFGNSKFRNIIKMHIQINKLKKELVSLKKENEQYKEKICVINEDPFYIEEIARCELGLIKPGEVEYRFIKKK